LHLAAAPCRFTPSRYALACALRQYSAEGCYFDAHDHAALCRVLLDPLGPGGNRRVQHAVDDAGTDTLSAPPATTAYADAVLLFEACSCCAPNSSTGGT